MAWGGEEKEQEEEEEEEEHSASTLGNRSVAFLDEFEARAHNILDDGSGAAKPRQKK